MYVFIVTITIIALLALSKLPKSLIKDFVFLWLVIIDLKLLNSIEHKHIFDYLVLFFIVVQLYVIYIKKKKGE